MTFADLVNSTAYWLDDLQLGYFTSAQVKLWLNNAQRETQKRLLKANENYYLKCLQTTLVVNQKDYVLPDDFMKLHRLEVVMSGLPPNEQIVHVIPVTLNQTDLVPQNTGSVQFYYFKKNRMVVEPAPDTALTMRLYYSYRVSDMVNDTDLPDVPEQYHEMIALLAAEDGFIKDGRVSALLEKKIKEYQEHFDQEAEERNQDLPRMVVETGEGVGGGFYW